VKQSGRRFEIHALKRSSRVAGMVVRAYNFPGGFPEPVAGSFSMGMGVFYF
jgi:hypothetical protein